jgi:hypothetical protein
VKCIPRWQNLSPAKGSQSHRMCEAISVLLWHLWQMGLYAIPSLKRYPMKWQCPVNRPVTCLAWILLALKTQHFLFAEGLVWKPFACFCPGLDCQYSWCFLHIQSLIAHPKTLTEMLQVVSGSVNRYRVHFLAIWSVVSFSLILLHPDTDNNCTFLCSTSVTRD